jgi:HEAT repeat protein
MLRTLAAIALGEIGRTDSQPMLRRLMNDADSNVRLVAAGAILEIDQKH